MDREQFVHRVTSRSHAPAAKPALAAQGLLVESPSSFIVERYAPGFTIDFRRPPASTDLEELRRSFDLGALSGMSSERELVEALGQMLVSLGVTEDTADISESLAAFTGERDFERQVTASLTRLGVEQAPRDLPAGVGLLLRKTGCLDRNAHHPMRLYCHVPADPTQLEEGATHYGYTLEGPCTVTRNGRTMTIASNSYFCVAGAATVEGAGQCVIMTRFGYKGLTVFGGEVEDWGRLNYIDGCTDTLLVAPVKRGDPCLNALYFPPSTDQTKHVHPSVRCGAIIAGEGVCVTPFGEHALRKGNIFFLPPETYHAFKTDDRRGLGRSSLSVLAFHPDSDFGPTDTDHPMVNRTYFRFLHRLRSSSAVGAV